MVIENVVAILVLYGTMFLCIFIKFIHKALVDKKLFKQVKFCMQPINKKHSFDECLFDILLCKQSTVQVYPKYRIKEDDKKVVNDILTVFQRNMTNLYFNNRLNTSKYLLNMDEVEYFMFNLYEFLNANTCEEEFAGYVMFNYVNKVDKWTSCYSLTDHGIIYYKLNYIASVYLREYKLIEKIYNINNYNEHEKYIKGKIDKRKIELMR